jgi:hypothetical protein
MCVKMERKKENGKTILPSDNKFSNFTPQQERKELRKKAEKAKPDSSLLFSGFRFLFCQSGGG